MKLPFKLLPVLCTVALLGCSGAGGDGPQRYSIKGSVSRNGEAVSAGSLGFEPNAAAGNSGPPSTAKVVNGKYEISKASGVAGGEYIVTLFPPEVESGSTVDPKSQFKPMQMNITLPTSDSETDLKFVTQVQSGS